MSSIMACKLPAEPVSPCSSRPSSSPIWSPPPWSAGSAARTPGTRRGVLSSEDNPIDWARRLAGSTVSTTTWRPRSAARSPTAAAIVVLPTPPEPQQTMILVRRSSMSWSTTSGTGVVLIGLAPQICSRGTLVAQGFGQPVERGQVDPVGDQRQLVARLSSLVEQAALGPLRAGGPCLVG